MKIGRFLILPVIILIVGIIADIVIIGSFNDTDTGTARFNDITQTVKENIDHPERLSDIFPDTDLTVYDCEGFVIYSGGSSGPTNPVQAMKEGYICLPVTNGNRFLGTAAVPDPERTAYTAGSAQLMTAAAVMLLSFILAAAMFFYYVYINIIRPFITMQEFARQIAAGRLDDPLIMSKSNIFGVFTESFDIMREELKAARERENQLKIKEKELVAALSHDLKTPITGIDVICEVLRVKATDEYILGKVESIHEKTKQMNLLVSDLLASALDDLGELTVNCTDENSAVLHEIVAANDPKGLTNEESIPECLIRADKARLSQIMGNIIGNSYKYAGTAIDVRYKLSGEYLKMSLADHGKGVPEDELDLITNKFYRGRDVRSGKTAGSGLGLYISAELIGKMGGELICSGRGDGLTVSLMIPLS